MPFYVLHLFQTAPPTTQCNSDVTTIDNPVTSPSYPNVYGDNRSCYTRITASPSDKVVMLVFKTFHIEYSSTCSYDSLSIYDGAGTSASLIGKYCSESPGILISSSQHMYLSLTSDSSVSYPGYTADVLFINGTLVTFNLSRYNWSVYNEPSSIINLSADPILHGSACYFDLSYLERYRCQHLKKNILKYVKFSIKIFLGSSGATNFPN